MQSEQHREREDTSALCNMLDLSCLRIAHPLSRSVHYVSDYRDLWKLDLTSWQWELVSGGEKGGKGGKGGIGTAAAGASAGPSARSGHRMQVYKHKLLVFGGFYVSSTHGGYSLYISILFLSKS